jgi:hypothetical protein
VDRDRRCAGLKFECPGSALEQGARDDAPTANIAGAHANAVVSPCTAAWAISVGVGWVWALVTKLVRALVATVESSAMPSEPPTCWAALTVADATPESEGRTPRVGLLIALENTRPRRAARTMRAGRISVVELDPKLRRVR